MPLFSKLGKARDRLIEAGISADQASLDVDLYARTILGWDRAKLLTERHASVPPVLEPTFSEWIARRARREPSAYIVGVREFWGLDFAVTPAVLIPRPETELIIEEVLALLRSGARAARIADIGTGSGCLAITIAGEVQGCRLVASDLSHSVLDVARANAERHGVVDRIEFVCTSYLDGVIGSFDLIVANPPYVKDGDTPGLAASVRYEPQVALLGGADGLRNVGGVLETARQKLTPGGWLIMEFGYGQEAALHEMVSAVHPLHLDHVRTDLQGIARTAVIQALL